MSGTTRPDQFSNHLQTVRFECVGASDYNGLRGAKVLNGGIAGSERRITYVISGEIHYLGMNLKKSCNSAVYILLPNIRDCLPARVAIKAGYLALPIRSIAVSRRRGNPDNVRAARVGHELCVDRPNPSDELRFPAMEGRIQ